MLEYLKQLIKHTITGQLIVTMFLIFIVINVYRAANPTLVNLLFVQIPGVITPGMVFSNFSHIELSHLFVNLYGLFIVGPMIERISGKRIFIKLILFSMLFTILGVHFFSPAPVLGFSGILMGMLSFMYFRYKNLGMLRNQIGILLALNIGIGFFAGISLVGHLFGAIGGFVYYYLLSQID